MDKSQPAKQGVHLAGSEDVRRLFRHIDDHTIAAVLALKPTIAQLEEAVARASGGPATCLRTWGPSMAWWRASSILPGNWMSLRIPVDKRVRRGTDGRAAPV